MFRSNTAIQLKHVTHWFARGSDEPVVRDINFSVEEHEFVSLVGASGCGKTTILNIIAGLVQPERGSCSVNSNGQVVSLGSHRLGYMTARDALLPWRTLLKNVELGLEFRGLDKIQRSQKAREMIALVGLDGFENAYPRELSHGMRQRANLARLLATKPSILLMDEPFGALDAQTKATMQREFMSIWEREQQTVVFVTHDLNEAALMSTRVVVMAPQRIQSDTPVPFPNPRDLNALRFDHEFGDFEQLLWNELETATSMKSNITS